MRVDFCDGDFTTLLRYWDYTEEELPKITNAKKQLSPILEQITNKLCTQYRKYDPDGIPIAFEYQQLLHEQEWWRSVFIQIRTILSNTLGSEHDLSDIGRCVECFADRYAYCNTATNQRILAALARGETVYRTDPICRDDYQEPTTKGE